MAFRSGIQYYQETRVQTTNPAKLIALLYDRLAQELVKVREFIQERKYFDKGNAIIKCQDIVLELNNSLNLEAGPIAKNLQALYLFIFKELNWINLHNDAQKLEKIIKIVDNLKEAWDVISGQKIDNGESEPRKSELAETR